MPPGVDVRSHRGRCDLTRTLELDEIRAGLALPPGLLDVVCGSPPAVQGARSVFDGRSPGPVGWGAGEADERLPSRVRDSEGEVRRERPTAPEKGENLRAGGQDMDRVDADSLLKRCSGCESELLPSRSRRQNSGDGVHCRVRATKSSGRTVALAQNWCFQRAANRESLGVTSSRSRCAGATLSGRPSGGRPSARRWRRSP